MQALRAMMSAMVFFSLCPVSFAAEQWTPVNSDGTVASSTAEPGIINPDAADVDERLKQIINIEYKEAELTNVLRSLSWTYKLNIVTGPDVKGKVNINLQEISVEQALQAILTVNGLIYSKRGGVIYISSGDASVVEIRTQVISLQYVTATQAQNLAKEVLSPKGDIKIDEVSNTIIVTDYESSIAKIKELISQVDLAPKQVLIEAKIVDITSTDLRSLGLQWDTDYQPVTGGLFGRKTRAAEALTGGFNLGSSSDLDTGQFTLDALTLKNATFTGRVDSLLQDGKAELLASPSIAVINGQEARIVIGERFPYKERTQTTSGTTETTKFVDIGVTLKVTPQINDDGYITLAVHPEVSSLLQSLDAGPRITTREADTTVRVKQGETLIIGGLIRQSDNTGKSSIPFLGNIPVIGTFFSNLDVSKEQKELAVFITPRILFSREEALKLGRKDELKESYTLLDRTSILSVTERIFEKAKNLDTGVGLDSVRKTEDYRKQQALGYYETIYKQFPESQRAAESEYNSAMIHWKYYKDFKRAKIVLASLISDFPNSKFAEKSRENYKEIEKQEEQIKKKRKS